MNRLICSALLVASVSLAQTKPLAFGLGGGRRGAGAGRGGGDQRGAAQLPGQLFQRRSRLLGGVAALHDRLPLGREPGQRVGQLGVPAHALVDFGDRGLTASICDADFSPPRQASTN